MTASSSHRLLTSAEVVALLQGNFDRLAEEFHVASLALFGSYAHGEQTPESDVDLLVSFSQPVGFGFIHLAERLEALLGKPVDLLAADGIKPNRRDVILSSVIHVAPSQPVGDLGHRAERSADPRPTAGFLEGCRWVKHHAGCHC